MTSDSNRSGPSRADALRQKRQQTSQQRVSEVRQQVVRPTAQAHTATTVRRTSPYAVPNASTTRTASARKLHYARGANGVEVRMPALPSLHFNWQTGSLVLAFCLLIGVILLASLDTFQVSAVQLTGSKRVTAADVTSVLIAKRQSIFTLDSNQTIAALKSSFPEFSSIRLSIHFPNTVALAVTERQPVLAWSENGKTEWIAADGVVMPARGDAGSLLTIESSVAVPSTTVNPDGSPIVADASATAEPAAATTNASAQTNASVSSKPTIDVADSQVVQVAISLSAQLPSGASLVYDPVSGMGWNDPQGWQVYFGLDLSNLALKESEYEAITQRLKALGIQPKLISVAHVDAPYYRTE